MSATPQIMSVMQAHFGALVVPQPLVAFAGYSELFDLDAESLGVALREGTTFKPEFGTMERFRADIQPVHWAWAFVGQKFSRHSPQILEGAKLLARKLVPLELDISVIETGGAYMVGAKRFNAMASATSYLEQSSVASRIASSLPRPFDPYITRTYSFATPKFFVQHAPQDYEKFKTETEGAIRKYYGEIQAQRYRSRAKRGGLRKDMNTFDGPLESPLSLPVEITMRIDDQLREWTASYYARHPEKRAGYEEWPLIIKGGWPFFNSRQIQRADELQNVLDEVFNRGKSVI